MRGDLRLLIPAASAWVGGWCAITFPTTGTPIWAVPTACWAAASVVLIVLLCGVYGRKRAGALPANAVSRTVRTAGAATALVAFAAAALVASCAAYGLASRASTPLAEAAAARTEVAIVLELSAAPKLLHDTGPVWATHEQAARVQGRVVSVDSDPIASVRASALVELDDGEPAFGSRVAFTARAVEQDPFERAAFVLRPTSSAEESKAPAPWFAWAAWLRAGFADAAGSLPGDGGALVPGLAIGDTSAVSEELDQAMKASSLSHLTAVSGANCALVTAAVFWAAARTGQRRWVRIVAAATALLAFVILVTPESSVVRAAAMALVVLIAIASGRGGGGIAALSLAVIVLLAIDPWYARDYGFGLSVFATGGLLLLAAPLARALERWMPLPLAIVLGVPLAAQLACQPILVLLDPTLPLYGVPANLLAAPAAPLGTVAGVIGCLLLPVLPSVGYACLQLAWLPASWIAVLAHGASAAPLARVPWVAGVPGAVLVVAITATLLWIVLRPPRNRWGRRLLVAIMLVAVAVPIGSFVVAPRVEASALPRDWNLVQCDVGQGDAVLVRDADEVLLVDTGEDPAALERCLRLVGVEHIDVVVLTHWDADHVGGASAIMGRADLVLHGPLDGSRSSEVLDSMRTSGAELLEVAVGDRGDLGDGHWRVLWPATRMQPGNAASVVIEVETSRFEMMLLGDLGEHEQAALNRRENVSRVDVVKVAHHGSSDQYSALYRALEPTLALIGVGVENGYGHPTESLLTVLDEVDARTFRTDLDGTAVFAIDDDSIRFWREHSRSSVGARP